MNLGEYLAHQLIEVQKAGDIKTIVAIYGGRFQPMGTHHAKTYKWVASKFDDAWVVTSDKVQLPKSPLNFNEKKKIINKHGIRKVAKVKNPYRPTEVLDKYDPETTAAVFIVGKKDQERLGGKFFRPWKGVAEVGYRDGAYTMIAPHVSLNIPGVGEMSGTTIRQALSQNPDSPEAKKLFKGIMGWYDAKLHKMISSKLFVNEIVKLFIDKYDFSFLKEISTTVDTPLGDVDDGPQTWYKNLNQFKGATNHVAQKLGMNVLSYLGIGDFDSDGYPEKFEPPSFFQAGDQGKTSVTNTKDFKSDKAYREWLKYITNLSNILGMEFLNFLDADVVKYFDDTENAPELQGGGLDKAIDDLLGEGLLIEGGAYGHMRHPFDDNNLTFGDIKNIIRLSLQGNLSMEKVATEKTDGQNLFVSWKDGKLVAARNVGDLKRGGMDAKAVAAKFAGRGNIEKAFNSAMNDLSKAIGSLTDAQKEKIFANGGNWVNMEIIYPPSENVISYDAPYLQFHNVLSYSGSTPTGEVMDGARMLAGMVKQINKNLQKSFSIIGPNPLKIKANQDFTQRQSYFIKKLDKLRNEYRLSDTSTLAEYHQSWWSDYIDKNFKGIDQFGKMGLLKRWAFGDKSFRLNKQNISDETLLAKAIKFDKQNHQDQIKKNMFPFETLIFELGAEVLKNVEGFLAVNPNKAIQNIRKQLAKAISDVRRGGDLKKLKRVDQQLAKIKAIGGWNTIVPSEGLVFIYKGNTYKLTGAFAPINQITGLMNFD